MAATQPRRLRRKNNTTTELPLDVIFNNILPRLPAKYVKRYLCVSKEWYSFLKSPMFANMHVNHASNDDHQNHHKLLVLYKKGSKRGRKKGRLSYSNRDCETQKPGMHRRRPLPFGHTSKDIYVKSSCNGLVLVALRYDYGAMLSDLIIWNPLTNDYKTLSKIDLNITYYGPRFELYYNSSEQDYRVLLITGEDNDVYIYSLKSDSWRKINLEYSPSTCWNNDKLYFKRLFSNAIITMFDSKTEKFTNISIVPIQDNWICRSVIVQRGCVPMCIKHLVQVNTSFEPCIKLWSMDRTGAWENTSTYTQVRGTHQYFSMEPLHLMRDGNWLMQHGSKSYYEVDLERGLYPPYKLQGSVAGVYIETFVSPNQYTN